MGLNCKKQVGKNEKYHKKVGESVGGGSKATEREEGE